MADIVIRGMKMPKNCSDCGQCRWSNFLQCSVCRIAEAIGQYGIFKSEDEGLVNRPFWCPLFPLPEGHGRCIDADALIANHFSDEHRIALSPANKLWMRRIINAEFTILSAEGG